MEFTFILWLMSMCGCYTGVTFGSIFDNHDDGFRLMQILMIAFFMSAGIFVNTSKAHTEGVGYFTYYLQFVSPSRYCSELLVREELAGRNKYLEAIMLRYLGYTFGDRDCYLFLVGYWIFVFIVGWLVLLWKARFI